MKLFEMLIENRKCAKIPKQSTTGWTSVVRFVMSIRESVSWILFFCVHYWVTKMISHFYKDNHFHMNTNAISIWIARFSTYMVQCKLNREPIVDSFRVGTAIVYRDKSACEIWSIEALKHMPNVIIMQRAFITQSNTTWWSNFYFLLRTLHYSIWNMK